MATASNFENYDFLPQRHLWGVILKISLKLSKAYSFQVMRGKNRKLGFCVINCAKSTLNLNKLKTIILTYFVGPRNQANHEWNFNELSGGETRPAEDIEGVDKKKNSHTNSYPTEDQAACSPADFSDQSFFGPRIGRGGGDTGWRSP